MVSPSPFLVTPPPPSFPPHRPTNPASRPVPAGGLTPTPHNAPSETQPALFAMLRQGGFCCLNSLPSAKPASGPSGRLPRINLLRPSRARSEGFTQVFSVHMNALPAEACPERTAGWASYSFEMPLPLEVVGSERPIGGIATTISRKKPGEKQRLHTPQLRSAFPSTRESCPPDLRRPCNQPAWVARHAYDEDHRHLFAPGGDAVPGDRRSGRDIPVYGGIAS